MNGPTYGATNHDIIDVCRRITAAEQRLDSQIAILLKALDRIEAQAPLLINISARLEAFEDRADINTKAIVAVSDRLEALEDKLGDTGDGKADRSVQEGSVSQPLNNWNNEGGNIP